MLHVNPKWQGQAKVSHCAEDESEFQEDPGSRIEAERRPTVI